MLHYLYRHYIGNKDNLQASYFEFYFELPEFFISNGTIIHTLEAKYHSDFGPNLFAFTQLLAKSVCDLKL